MKNPSERATAMWTFCAIVGAAVLAREAVAGNYFAVVPNNSGIQYFSVRMHHCDRLKTTSSCALQILIDDITYGIQIQPSQYTPVVYPLWRPPEFVASYETGATGGTVFPLSYTVFSAVLAPGPLPSGRSINYDVEVWSNARANPYQEELQEVDNTGAFVRALDISRQFQGGNMHGRAEYIPGGTQGDVAGVGISEVLVTLSGSRHFKTPHIIPIPNELTCDGPRAAGLATIDIYVKGRVVVDAADELTENAVVVH